MKGACLLVALCALPTLVTAQTLLWDNQLAPPFGTRGGRAVMPPGFPNMRVVDDFVIEDSAWIVSEFVVTLLEHPAWESSGRATVYIYATEGGRPGALALSGSGPDARVYSGADWFLPAFYHTVSVSLKVSGGVWWIGLRDPDATGEEGSSAYWTTSQSNRDRRSTGYFSFDAGKTWQPEGTEWHHPFEIWGFVAGRPTDGFFRRITPIEFQGLPQGDLDSIRSSDDDYYRVRAAHTFRLSKAHNAALLLETRFPTFPLQRLDLLLETGTEHSGVRQEVALYDFVAARWVVLDDRPLPPGADVTVAIENIPSPERFLRPADGAVMAKVEAYSWGTTLSTHELRVDTAKFVVTYE